MAKGMGVRPEAAPFVGALTIGSLPRNSRIDVQEPREAPLREFRERLATELAMKARRRQSGGLQ